MNPTPGRAAPLLFTAYGDEGSILALQRQTPHTDPIPASCGLPMTKIAKRDHTEHDVERGLYALIAFGGSPAPASRALKDAFGLEIAPATLKSWRDGTHAQRYTDLQAQHAQDIEDAMVRDTRDLARAAGALVREAIELTHDKIEKQGHLIRAAEAAQIAASMAKVQQTQIDKMLTLTGRPESITESRTAADIIRALAAKGVNIEPAG